MTNFSHDYHQQHEKYEWKISVIIIKNMKNFSHNYHEQHRKSCLLLKQEKSHRWRPLSTHTCPCPFCYDTGCILCNQSADHRAWHSSALVNIKFTAIDQHSETFTSLSFVTPFTFTTYVCHQKCCPLSKTTQGTFSTVHELLIESEHCIARAYETHMLLIVFFKFL